MQRSRPLPAHRLRPAALATAACALAACSDSPSGPPQPADGTAAPELAVSAAASNSWAPKRLMPTARQYLVAAAVNGIVYAIGGDDPNHTVLRKVEAYNSATNTWSTKAPLPSARERMSGAAVINGLIYVPGGSDAAGFAQKSLFVYNPSTNSWSRKRDLPVYSAYGVAAAINGKLYVLSPGNIFSGPPVPPSLHRYDPATDRWTQLATPPRHHRQGAGGVINGKLYVAGGTEPGAFRTAFLDVYDPATNRWTSGPAMPTEREAVAGRVVNGRLYAVGGFGRNSSGELGELAVVEVYDPVTNSWERKADMPTARENLAIGAVNGILYALGGRNYSASSHLSGILAQNEAYTP